MVEEDLGHAREDSKREYYHKGSQLLKPKHISTFTNGCLSRQPSLVINIVGTDDSSRLPHLVTGSTDVSTLLSLLFRNSRPPTWRLGRPAAANKPEG
jgi:hypothetical protein